MRNLKRALSLALSTVMLVGMMAVGTSAASYADVDSADNVEAIEVMKAVSVMVGDENGNFNPDKNVTRAEMAVVMANLLDLQVEDFVGASIPFTDVPQWAHSFVAACYADGITGGISATQYGSNNSVTATQAALMLLKALGYFQYSSDFGTDWQVATIKQASNVGLFEGIDSARNAAMTRNEVAQIALNALEASEFDSKGTFENKKPSDSGDFKPVAGLYTLTDKANGDDKSGNDKFNAEAFTGNDNYTVKANGTLSASVAKDDTNMTVNGTKVYMNKDTNYIAVEKDRDDLDVSTAVGGMKCAKDDADKVLVISNKDDSRTAVYVLYIGDDLSSSVVSDEVVYVAEKSDEQNADGWVTTLYFMENNSSDDVTVETQVEPGFYYYDVDEDDVYSLEGVTGLGNDDVDDDTNGWDTLVINESSIYSTQNLLTKDNFSDIAFGSAKVIDSRDNIDSDKIYDKEITSVSNLKNAAKNGNITIRVYVTDGEITFIDVIGAGDGVKAPVIGTQPQNATVTAGSITGELTVAATGKDLTYQWYKDGAKISNETKATLTIPTDLTAGTYKFYVEVTSSKDGYTSTVKSTEVTVTVKPVKPATTGATATRSTGYDVDLELTAGYVKDAAYKLYKGGVEIEGLTLDTKTENHVKFTGKADNFETGSDYTLEITVNGQTNTSDAFTINAHA